MGVRSYTVHIVGLSKTTHPFEFEVGNEFFSQYGTGLISEGTLKAEVVLDKRETFIEAGFTITGSVRLICDRSLDGFDYPIRAEKKLVFKYGDSDQELSDEIIMIHRDTDRLDLGQYIFEFIALEVPIKKLHPRFSDEEEEEAGEGKIIYTSKPSGEDDNGEDIDPRWEILKKLK
jgi:uncharacterized metal-binding protein YceD (DUF177 family)